MLFFISLVILFYLIIPIHNANSYDNFLEKSPDDSKANSLKINQQQTNNNQALDDKKLSKNKSLTTKIRSEIITINRTNQNVEFNDNVIVEKDDSSLLADKMIVIYEENKSNDLKSKKTEIKRIDAFNHVKIFSDDSTASAQTGYYDPKKNIFVLQKNVIVNNGTSIASGEKFVYDISTKKGNFIGNQSEVSQEKNPLLPKKDQRVTVIIGDDIKDIKKSKKAQ
jgi:lipopolysaccharide export system protein LptA